MFSIGEIHTRPNSARLHLLGAMRYLRKRVPKAVAVANRIGPDNEPWHYQTQKNYSWGTRALSVVVLVYER